MEVPAMESMAAAIGVSAAVLRFLLCFVATIPVGLLWRAVPGGLPKHAYAAATGAFLSYLSFGVSSNLHFLAAMSLGYGSMLAFRRWCGVFTFFAAFGYLIGCHVYYMSGDAWKEGGIDATGNTALINFIIEEVISGGHTKIDNRMGICSASNIDLDFGSYSSLIRNLNTQENLIIIV